jgi:sialic acid synthase SpsE
MFNGKGAVPPLDAGVKKWARHSLVAACDIQEGEELTPDNVDARRPGTGIPAEQFDEWMGYTARHPINAGEQFQEDWLEPQPYGAPYDVGRKERD